ncbi:MAG: peptide-methionine (S)-S-oxide reductase MsrA [Nanoarchaeota archaeon]
MAKVKTEEAIFAAGCFWGVEYAFAKVKGVISAESGYTGGVVVGPNYEQVCSGKTGHAEAVKVVFDSDKISYTELLRVFWKCHNPTTMNRQGADVGSQYRSAIFYTSEKQKKEALKSREELQKKLDRKIVTEISKAGVFYRAEEYHQKYAEKNGASCHI